MNKRDTDQGGIVVFVDGTTATRGILQFAAVLAQEHSTHLIAVFMQPQPAVTVGVDRQLNRGVPELPLDVGRLSHPWSALVARDLPIRQ